MRHPVMIILAALCFLLLPEFALAEEMVAPQSSVPIFGPSRYGTSGEVSEGVKNETFSAQLKAMGLANKKRLTVPLSVDGIIQVRVRRASGLGGESYVSCISSGVSSNLDLSAIVSALESVCDAINSVANKVSEFRSGYDLVLSLKKPLMGVSILKWPAATLDDAMTLVRSIQEGRVEAAIVRTHWPKEKPEPGSKPIKFELESCQECLIMEWVFRFSGKK